MSATEIEAIISEHAQLCVRSRVARTLCSDQCGFVFPQDDYLRACISVSPRAEAYSPTRRLQYVGVASFTVLVWDHMITLCDEVRAQTLAGRLPEMLSGMQIEYIWKRQKGPCTSGVLLYCLITFIDVAPGSEVIWLFFIVSSRTHCSVFRLTGRLFALEPLPDSARFHR